MPTGRLTARQLGRMQRHFTHSVKIERIDGMTNDLENLTDLGTYSCLWAGVSRTTFGSDRASQDYDGTLFVRAPEAFSDRNARYKLTLEFYKGTNEKSDPDGPPEIKSTILLEPVQIDDHSDMTGNQILQVIRCKNAKQAS